MKKNSEISAENELGKASIFPLLLKYSIPAILNMFISVFYSFIDAVFLAWSTPDGIGVAVVALAMPLTLLIWAIALLVGQGGNALAAIYIGKNKIQKAEKCAANCLILFVFFALLLAFFAIYLLDYLLFAAAISNYLIPMAKQFVEIHFFGAIFFFISIGFANFLRSVGAPIYSFVVNLISIIVCIFVNWLLVLQFNMGVVGSATATVIGQSVGSVFVIMFFIFSKKNHLKLRITNFRINFSICKKILVMGLSSFAMSMSTIIIGIVFNWTVAYYGALSPIGVDGAFLTIGAVQRFIPLLYMPIVGISIGSQPIIGYSFGAKNYSRALLALKYSILISMIYGVIVTVLCNLFAVDIIRIFRLGEPLQTFAVYTLKIEVIFYVLVGFQIQGGSYFQSSGQPIKSMLLEASRQILILIPLYIILPPVLTCLGFVQDGLYTVIWCPPVADLFSFLITFVFVIIEINRLKQQLKK